MTEAELHRKELQSSFCSGFLLGMIVTLALITGATMLAVLIT